MDQLSWYRRKKTETANEIPALELEVRAAQLRLKSAEAELERAKVEFSYWTCKEELEQKEIQLRKEQEAVRSAELARLKKQADQTKAAA